MKNKADFSLFNFIVIYKYGGPVEKPCYLYAVSTFIQSTVFSVFHVMYIPAAYRIHCIAILHCDIYRAIRTGGSAEDIRYSTI